MSAVVPRNGRVQQLWKVYITSNQLFVVAGGCAVAEAGGGDVVFVGVDAVHGACLMLR